MFSMNLDSGESPGHAVVVLRGELDLLDAAAVAAALKDVAAREPWIIVDLTGLNFIDARGVAALLSGRRHARKAGGELLLAAPQRRVRLVLAIIWPDAGPGFPATVAEAAATTSASRQAVVPVQRPSAEPRRQRTM
jgi:anti-anti-sigma factor